MDEDIRGGESPGIVLAGEPDPAAPGILPQRDGGWDIDADWWGPGWDVVTSAGHAEPSTGAARARRDADDPDDDDWAGPLWPERVPRARASASPDPSWRQILSTTITLWFARRRGGAAPSRPRLRLVSAAVLGVGLLAVGAGAAGLIVTSGSAASAQRLPASPAPVPTPSGRPVSATWQATAGPVPRPVELTIPAIGVRAPVITLGLNRDGTLQVPSSTTVVGWYTGSPRPGAVGSAVIAGHVDSRAGPAVFFWLRKLRKGEQIYVRRADGTLAAFAITAVQQYAKDAFPTAAVYGPVPDSELRLITCGGTFDHAAGSYLSNVVVYARLAA
jgi:LPXTG-site transpeptidase (sortase) family protein